ncbi:sugar MFS transporter [Limibacter armeniacum]|uniref:sugar MFS transporter n=1 Tax=Limibacter armeniacum TaxID=466084 RepID=UPI002FE505A4
MEKSLKNQQTAARPNYTIPLVAMVIIFFIFGGLTALNSNVLTPYAKNTFGLTPGQSQIVNFAFFIAYFVMSLPASTLISKIGYKLSVVVGLAVVAAGSLSYLLAVNMASTSVFLIATFIVAAGIAILQTAANPYLAKLGDPSGASMRITIAGALNSLATYIAPTLGGAFILNAALNTTQQGENLRLTYIFLTILVALITVIIFFSKLPEIVDETTEEVKEAEAKSVKGPFSFRNLRFGVLGIFCYVGAEVGVASFIVFYMTETIGGFSAEIGAKFAAYYWLMAMIGRFVGVPILKTVASEKALLVAAVINIGLIAGSILISNDITVSMFGMNVPVIILMLILVGLFNSVMWGCIFALGVDGLGIHTTRASGFMMMAVAGGAIMPYIQGLLSDAVGIKLAYIIPLLCYAYLAYFAINGHKKA